MPKKIKVTLTSLKSIEVLEFEVPPPGAYLLTGANGCGKTSLLTCLHRIGDRNAFQRGFKSSPHRSLDSFSGASVSYAVDGDTVKYVYTEERWAPTPKRNSKLLVGAYPAVIYIAADGTRVEPRKEDFAPRSVRAAPDELKEVLNSIFDTKRFDNLSYINLQGRNMHAYLTRLPGKTAAYFSEKNFSLGELCVLKLIRSVQTIKADSLVLIDELELAIHPRAQVRLFEYLQKIAKARSLTIIFSTHSVTLIKSAPRNTLLFLEKVGAKVHCVRSCYPTYVLGHLSASEENVPDSIIYVEDDSARKCVEGLLMSYRQTAQQMQMPTVSVAAIGGFKEVLNFMDRAPQLVPPHTRTAAFLDLDVKTESVTEYQAENNHEMLSLFQRVQSKLHYLPWTPEVGLVADIASDRAVWRELLKQHFADNRIALDDAALDSVVGLTGSKLRKQCKEVFHKISSAIATLIGKDLGRVREVLFAQFASRHAQKDPTVFKALGAAIHS